MFDDAYQLLGFISSHGSDYLFLGDGRFFKLPLEPSELLLESFIILLSVSQLDCYFFHLVV